jgi:hypothetical protein
LYTREHAEEANDDDDDDDDDHSRTLISEVRRRQRVDTPPWSRSLVWTR